MSRFLLALKTETAPPLLHHLREKRAYLLQTKIAQQAQPLVLHGPVPSLRLCEGRITFKEPHPALSVQTFKSTLASSWVCTFSSCRRQNCAATDQATMVTKFVVRIVNNQEHPSRSVESSSATGCSNEDTTTSAVSKVCRPSRNGIHQLARRRRNPGCSVADVLWVASQTSLWRGCCVESANTGGNTPVSYHQRTRASQCERTSPSRVHLRVTGDHQLVKCEPFTPLVCLRGHDLDLRHTRPEYRRRKPLKRTAPKQSPASR